jgi:hypothetical protein
MALPTRTKTYILLGVSLLVLVIVVVPFRFTPSGPMGISLLSLETRAHLVQHYEKPAQGMKPRVDSLRKAIVARVGYTVPSQDSVLGEMEKRAAQALQLIDHLRNPSRETFEEKNSDVTTLLGQLMAEFEDMRQQLLQDHPSSQ